MKSLEYHCEALIYEVVDGKKNCPVELESYCYSCLCERIE